MQRLKKLLFCIYGHQFRAHLLAKDRHNLLAFALSIDDFVISNFNSGTTVTFPLYIYGAAQRGIPVEVNVIAMILFGVTVVAMGATVWQQRRAERMASVRPEQEAIPVPLATAEAA